MSILRIISAPSYSLSTAAGPAGSLQVPGPHYLWPCLVPVCVVWPLAYPVLVLYRMLNRLFCALCVFVPYKLIY